MAAVLVGDGVADGVADGEADGVADGLELPLAEALAFVPENALAMIADTDADPYHEYGYDRRHRQLLRTPSPLNLALDPALVSIPGEFALPLFLPGHLCGPPAHPQSPAVCLVWQRRCLLGQGCPRPRVRCETSRIVPL